MATSETSAFDTLLYSTRDAVATITLNRPEQLNTIVPPMPDEIEAAIGLAERDPAVKVIVLRGAGPRVLAAATTSAAASSTGARP